MAFAAVQGEVPPLAWLLFLGNLLWTTGYDTWYAMVDREDDLRAGSKSTAILFGDADLVALGILYGGFLVTMLLLGRRAELGVNYWTGLAVAAAFIAWQFAIGRDRRPENCFRAFLANQWVGLAVFARHRPGAGDRARAERGSTRRVRRARSPRHRPAPRRRRGARARIRPAVAPVVITSSTSATCAGRAGRIAQGEGAAHVAPACGGAQFGLRAGGAQAHQASRAQRQPASRASAWASSSAWS